MSKLRGLLRRILSGRYRYPRPAYAAKFAIIAGIVVRRRLLRTLTSAKPHRRTTNKPSTVRNRFKYKPGSPIRLVRSANVT